MLLLTVALGLAAVAAAQPGISTEALLQIQALQEEKNSWTLEEKKVSSKLLMEAKRSEGRGLADGLPALRPGFQLNAQGTVDLDIRATVTSSLLTRITDLGGNVISSVPQFDAIQASLPLGAVLDLARESDVKSIQPALGFMLNKTNTSEGDVAHRTDFARANYSLDGTGAVVGVLSDSIEALAALQTSGDLPATVNVLPGQSGTGSSEGTAMLEIVHDLAPAAELWFATAFGGEAQFAANILALQAAGCNVIVDDVSYFAEYAFQDGVIAQAVDTVTAAGVAYFSSAGNSGNFNDGTSGVWEGDFVSIAQPVPLSATGLGAHDFGGGVNFIVISADSPSFFILKWADAGLTSANDYDLYLLDATRTTVWDSSTNVQDGNDDPLEFIDSRSFNDASNTLVIIKKSGSDRMLHLNANRGRLAGGTSGQIYGHAGAEGCITVAAVDANVAAGPGGAYNGTESVEAFSSDGPRRIHYEANGTAITAGDFSTAGGELRQKPDIAAADGVATATPGFDPFYGTSAAAPHAAAIAALIIDKGDAVTPAAILAAMTGSAYDIEAAGIDRDSGAGIVDALRPFAPAQTADVSVTLNASVGTVSAAAFNYTVTVSNAGPNAADNVIVYVTLDDELNYVSDTCGAGSASGDVVTVNFGTVGSGGMEFCTITVLADAPIIGTEVTSMADMTTTAVDPVLVNDSDTETTPVLTGDVQ
jgi:uncharacterized repeat protein (TIGR01451 family)